MREGLVAFKDHGRWHLRRVLGGALARSVAGLLVAVDAPVEPPLVLVPAPGSPGSARLRDGDHVVELARAAARVLRAAGRPAAVVRALAPVRRRSDQVGLGRAARAANLAGSIAATSDVTRLAGSIVVVVDDLVTSGATLAECVRALREGGLEPVGSATVASVVTRGRATGPVPRAPVPPGATVVL